ncbi:MAG: hypothetical protein ACREB5_12435, partial [Sphingomonadaceae bacterium]
IMAYALAFAVLALAPTFTQPRQLQMLALAGLAFFAARLAAHTWTFWALDRDHQAQLVALDHVPMGARIFAMVGTPCFGAWASPRMDNLGSLAIVRRDAFVNGQWPQPGATLLSVKYAAADGFALDPTQLLRPDHCREDKSYTLPQALAGLPRRAFDYVWLINVPAARWPHDPGLVPVWRGRDGILYRINHDAGANTPHKLS